MFLFFILPVSCRYLTAAAGQTSCPRGPLRPPVEEPEVVQHSSPPAPKVLSQLDAHLSTRRVAAPLRLLKYLCSPAQTSPEGKLVSASFFFLWIWNFNSNLWRWLPKEKGRKSNWIPQLFGIILSIKFDLWRLKAFTGLLDSMTSHLLSHVVSVFGTDGRFSLGFRLMQKEIKALACFRLVCLINCDVNATLHSCVLPIPLTQLMQPESLQCDSQRQRLTRKSRQGQLLKAVESPVKLKYWKTSVKDTRFLWNSTWICSLLFSQHDFQLHQYLIFSLWGSEDLLIWFSCFRLH